MLDINDVNFRMCKYKFDMIQLTVPGLDEPYVVKTLAIGDFVIEKDYDQYQYPFFRVTIGVPNSVRRAMRKSHTEIRAYVRLMYAYFKTDETVGIVRKTPQEYKYIADNFIVFMEDTTPDSTSDIEEHYEEKMLPEDTVTTFQHMTTMEILLYRQKDLNVIKNTPTRVYNNARLIDILAHYMATSGVSNVLCSPPNNNNKVYSQFPIPPLRVDEQILRICCDYGLHKYGTSLFFDFDKTYLIEKINKCTAWVPNEYKTIYVINPTPTGQIATILQGCSYETRDHCGYCTMSAAQSDAVSMEREQVFGSSMTIIDKKTGAFNTVDSKTTTIKGGGAVSRTMTSYDGDASTATALSQRLIDESNVLTAVLDGTDLTMLAPNKLYKLVFLSSKLSRYNGQYRLSKIICSFTRKDGEWFTPTVAATFVGHKLTK